MLNGGTASLTIHAVELQHIAAEQREHQESQLRTLQKNLQNLLDFQGRFAEQGEKLYEDFFGGLLSKEDYVKQKTVLLEQREDAHKRETELRQRIADLSTANSRYVEKYSCYSELDTLTSEISFDLLDRVTIWPDGRLEITLNYLDESPLRVDGKGEYHNGSKESVDLLSGSAS